MSDFYSTIWGHFQSLNERYVDKLEENAKLYERLEEVQQDSEAFQEKKRAEEEAARQKLAERFSAISKLNPTQRKKLQFITNYAGAIDLADIDTMWPKIALLRQAYLCLRKTDVIAKLSPTELYNQMESILKLYQEHFVPVDKVFLMLRNETDADKKTIEDEMFAAQILQVTAIAQSNSNALKTRPKQLTPEEQKKIRDVGNRSNVTPIKLLTVMNDGQEVSAPVVTPAYSDRSSYKIVSVAQNTFPFTFTSVFNSDKDTNLKNFQIGIESIQAESGDVPLTIIAYGQSGSGKTTATTSILSYFSDKFKTSNYKFSAVQWYTTFTPGASAAFLKTGDPAKSGSQGTSVLNDILLAYQSTRPIPKNLTDDAFTGTRFVTPTVKFTTDSLLNFNDFMREINNYKFIRQTTLNPESSRSVVFITIYDERDVARVSVVDLPGSEEMSHATAQVTQKNKETQGIKAAISMFKLLFLNKQSGGTIDALGDTKLELHQSSTGFPNHKDKTIPIKHIKDFKTTTGFSKVDTLKNLCFEPLRLTEGAILGILNDKTSKLVLLITSYGTVYDAPATFDTKRDQSEATVKFANELAASAVGCEVPLEVDPVGGSKRRKGKRQTKKVNRLSKIIAHAKK